MIKDKFYVSDFDERSPIIRNFIESVDKYYLEKRFDLTDSKENLLSELTKRYLNGYYKNIKSGKGATTTLDRSIIKSFLPSNYNAIKEFVSAEDLKIVKPHSLIGKFLTAILPEGKMVLCNTAEDVRRSVAEAVVDQLQNVCGDVLYFKDFFDSSCDIKPFVRQICEERGFKFLDMKPFAYRENTTTTTTPNQSFLLEMYVTVAQRFVVDYAEHVKRYTTKDKFDKFWTVVEMFLVNAEERMTDDTKLAPAFVKCQAIVHRFFEDTKERAFSSAVYEGKRGEYLNSLKEAFKNIREDKQTHEDIAVVNDFYKKVVNLKQALSVVDEKGRNYPTNYFMCMPIPPVNFSLCIKGLLEPKTMALVEDFDKDSVEKARMLVNKTFGTVNRSNTGDRRETKEALGRYKGMRYTTRDIEIDLSTDEKYQLFVDKVDDIITKNNFPNSDVCIESIAKSLLMGRPAIKMPNEKGAVKEN